MTREWEAAVHLGSIVEVQSLLDRGADIDARDRDGQTALMLAAMEGAGELTAFLIDRGASLDHTAKYGLSALMLAVIRGHLEVVRRLTSAGADVNILGTGAPGFAGKKALDLAIERSEPAMIEILRAANPHFQAARNWKAARAMVSFRPIEPKYSAKLRLQSIRIYVLDHKKRELKVEDRTLEASYGSFSLSQVRKGSVEARRLALDVSYGMGPREITISGHAGRVYELGPEPEPDDIDGRSPAVVVWHDGEMFYLVSSYEMPVEKLVKIAVSFYA
jgi:hypothetical protein